MSQKNKCANDTCASLERQTDERDERESADTEMAVGERIGGWMRKTADRGGKRV
jgi:hypothetical protein